jgi:hypothetical protein
MQTRALARLVLALSPWFFPARLHAAIAGYNYQEYHGNGVAGVIGDGTLQLSNNTYTVRANYIKGNGSFIDNLVIFVDTAPGGFTTTSVFSDKGSPLETSISGVNVSRSVATFAPDFAADYAIALGVNSGSAVYKLVDDASGPHLELVRSGLNFLYVDSPNHATYSFQFDWADIGLPSRNTNFFKFETSYITSTGSRSLQSFEGLTGTSGFDFVTFTNYDTYGVPPVPENTNAALAIFGGLALAVGLGKKARVRLVAGLKRKAG